MAFPDVVTQRTITAGSAYTLVKGRPLKLVVTVKPSRSLVRQTGDVRLRAVEEEFSGTEVGAEIAFTLPVTDQAGWLDESTRAVIDVSAPNSHTHLYDATITLKDESGRTVGTAVKIPAFPVPTGDGSPIDLDLLLPGETVDGTQISIPDVWTGLVEAAQQAASDAAEAAALRIPVAEKGAANGVAPLDGSAKVPDANLPERLSEAELSATFAARNEEAMRSWVAAATAGGSITRIHGHSVIAGSGASAPAKRFASLLGRAIRNVDRTATIHVNGSAGFTSTQLLAEAVAWPQAAWSTNLVVFAGLLNDQSNNINPATSKANLLAILDAYRENQPTGAADPTFALVLEWPRQGTYTYPWEQYRRAAYGVASEAQNVVLIDAGLSLGAVTGSPYPIWADGVHPNDAGHRMLAQVVADALVKPLRPVVDAPIYPAHTTILAPLKPIASTNWNSAALVASTTMYGNAYADSNGTQNAEITYEWWGDAGTYDLRMSSRRGPNRGRYDILIDGVLQGTGATWDGYAASVTDFLFGQDGFTVGTSGRHTITLRMASKHESSAGYVGSLSAIFITRSA